MGKCNKIITILLMMAVTFSWCAPCHAGNAMKEIFNDGICGGVAGTLVGAALLAFTNKPGRHLDYLGYGAAIGTLGGVSVGAISSYTHALAEVENGKVKFGFPTIMPDIGETNSKGQTPIVIIAQLVKGKF